MSASGSRVERRRRAHEALSRLAATANLEVNDGGKKAGLSLHSVDAVVVDLLTVHGPLTPRELARHAAIGSSGTITGAIDRLERAGWTTRTPCQVDRRKVFITLTDAAPAGSSSAAGALDECTDDELTTTCRVLEKLSPPTSST